MSAPAIWLENIETERERRLTGRLHHDSTADVLWQRALNKSTNADDKNSLIQARQFAVNIDYHHDGLTADIYFAHPLRVAALSMLACPSHQVSAGIIGLLHNVLEVSSVTYDTIEQKFGQKIAHAIRTLTVDRALQWDKTYKIGYYEAIDACGAEAAVVKIFDKIDNLFLLGLNPDKKVRQQYLQEIETFIVPLTQKYLPHHQPYLKALIADARQMGFYTLSLAGEK